MVDFNKLKARKKKIKIIDPVDIFRRLPKPPGINDLYTSQAEVLQAWHKRRDERDIVLKLHTGGGKTLVGLLIAQSTLNEIGEPVVYLTPTVQLVSQTLEKAKEVGIPAVSYERGEPLNEKFLNANAIMIATYNALFNGQSKFGVRGGRNQAIPASAVILDDAHVAFSIIRDCFSLEINSDRDRELYKNVAGLFRNTFKTQEKLGTFDDVISGSEYAVLEVPYWAWCEKIDEVREILRVHSNDYSFIWPLIRDKLNLCHAILSKNAFTITTILPLVDMFPTFSDAARRIYMSANIADDGEIIRTFDANPESVKNCLTSRSLAGVSERMILAPALMPFDFKDSHIKKLITWTVEKDYGVLILVPSNKAAAQWNDIAKVASGSQGVIELIQQLQDGATSGPVVLANRYDGIDLPGNSCRLLVMSGLPAGTSSYEILRASTLNGSATIARMLAQRIEQGIGRGARGSGDYCVVLFVGKDLTAWISKDLNFKFLTSATQAQIKIGIEVSKEISDLRDLETTISRCYDRDSDWTEYYAETLAEIIDEETPKITQYLVAEIERRAFNYWYDGSFQKAISIIKSRISENDSLDKQTRGWMDQFAARIAFFWGNREKADELQREAYSKNRDLLRPSALPPYSAIPEPGPQGDEIVDQISKFNPRRGFLQYFEEVISNLNENASSNQFEQALYELAQMIGLNADRHDKNGEGPDVLWLLTGKVGWVIEVKSRKENKNPLTKGQHGQLLVSAEWFKNAYPGYKCVRVSVHPNEKATKAASADASHALTYPKLASLIDDARTLLTDICELQLPARELRRECSKILSKSSIKADRLNEYLIPFKQTPQPIKRNR